MAEADRAARAANTGDLPQTPLRVPPHGGWGFNMRSGGHTCLSAFGTGNTDGTAPTLLEMAEQTGSSPHIKSVSEPGDGHGGAGHVPGEEGRG